MNWVTWVVTTTLLFMPFVGNGVDVMGKTTYKLTTPDGAVYYFSEPDCVVNIGIPEGFGLPPLDHNTMTIYKQPGALLTDIQIKPRIVTITATLSGDCRLALHQARASLFSALRWNRTNTDPPPTSTLTYAHDGKSVNLKVHYLSDVTNSQGETADVIGVRLIAYDPMWYATTQTNTTVASAVTPNVSNIVGLIDGDWDTMGNPGTGTVYAIAISPDGDSVYVGGNFVNWAGIANADLIAKYTVSTATWSALGTGLSGASSYVFAIVIDANGDVYAGGSFTTAGGGAAANIAKFDTSAGTWSALGAGTNDWVQAIVIDPSTGDLYAGGRFTSPFNYIARWDVSGAAWVDLGLDTLDGFVYALAIMPGAFLFAGGSFTNADGVTMNNVGRYYLNFDFWVAMAGGGVIGTNGLVDAIAITPGGIAYVGGTFTTAGNVSASKIAMWNGAGWAACGSGVNAQVYTLTLDNSGLLYVGGVFTSAGGMTLADAIATWNGTAWNHIDCDLPGVATVTAIAASGDNRFYGFDTSGAIRGAGAVTNVPMLGSAETYPQITVLGPGILQYIENNATGKKMIFNMWVNPGETITIDLAHGVKTITSNWRGDMLPYAVLLPTSNFGTFALVPDPVASAGQNPIRVMMTDTTGATDIHMLHYNAYLSADEAVR